MFGKQVVWVLVVVPVVDDGPAGRVHLSAQPAPKAAYTSQQLINIHFPWPKETQKRPRVKSEWVFFIIIYFNCRDLKKPKLLK